MKRFVDGREVELSDAGVEIVLAGDRLEARGPEGVLTAVAVRQGESTLVSYRGRQFVVERHAPRSDAKPAAAGELRAPMPGLIVEVHAREGDAVQKGQALFTLEAMKTQQGFFAPFDGTLTRLAVRRGDQTKEGALLAVVAPRES